MRKILSAVFVFVAISVGYGQEKSISLKFDSILFRDFIDTLENIVPYRFYYGAEWLDSLELSVNENNVSFNRLLDNVLLKDGLSYFMADGEKVIIVRGQVRRSFRDEYLGYLSRSIERSDTTKFAPAGQKSGEERISDEYRIFRIGKLADSKKGQTAVLSGTVRNRADSSKVAGAIIYVEKLKTGVMTDNNGHYSITLPKGQYQIEYRLMGMTTARRNVMIYSDGSLDIDMDEKAQEVEAVFISSSRTYVKDVRSGIEKINVKMLKQIPMSLGEVDIIKSSLMLPGIKTVGEASAGYNVRGGGTDQNLIFINNAPIINTSHFFGFFSAFNSDLVSDVTLYKSGMPARYGGRLSSVMEVVPATGNREKIKVSGGISPVTGRVMTEGPIDLINGSFIIGARATYSDWLLGMLKNPQLSKSSAGFYDVQGLVKSEINKKNTLSLSGYLSNDKFDYYRECAFDYGNFASTLELEHIFGPKLSVRFFVITSNYRYQVDFVEDSTNYSSLNYRLHQEIFRGDFVFYPSDKHRLEFGLDATGYSLSPGVRKPLGDYSIVTGRELEREQAVEPSLYLSDEYEVTPLLSISGGLRFTMFTSLGPKTGFIYADGFTRSLENITDTIIYSRGEVIKTYPGLDFRLMSRLIVTPGLSLKAGIQRVHQYIHMISNTTSMSPTDIWKLSDIYFKPQRSDQISLGLYNSFGRNAYETSIEGYYKNINNILDYKGGATLLMNEHLETEVINGNGKAYGVELMVKKQAGALTGWVSYSYSRILHKVDGRFEVEKVNDGNYFPADYDKPHDFKLVANAKLMRRFNMTTNFVYSTGRPVTYPVAFYKYNNKVYLYYSGRNEYRLPDYARLDLALTFNGNLKAKKLNHSSMTLTVYNLLGRKNPYSIFFREEDGVLKGYQMTIFSRPVVMVSYNFRILGNAKDDF